jgi:hypothetical protein
MVGGQYIAGGTRDRTRERARQHGLASAEAFVVRRKPVREPRDAVGRMIQDRRAVTGLLVHAVLEQHRTGPGRSMASGFTGRPPSTFAAISAFPMTVSSTLRGAPLSRSSSAIHASIRSSRHDVFGRGQHIKDM